MRLYNLCTLIEYVYMSLENSDGCLFDFEQSHIYTGSYNSGSRVLRISETNVINGPSVKTPSVLTPSGSR